MVVERIAIDVVNVPMPAPLALNARARRQKRLSNKVVNPLALPLESKRDMQVRAPASPEHPAFLEVAHRFTPSPALLYPSTQASYPPMIRHFVQRLPSDRQPQLYALIHHLFQAGGHGSGASNTLTHPLYLVSQHCQQVMA